MNGSPIRWIRYRSHKYCQPRRLEQSLFALKPARLPSANCAFEEHWVSNEFGLVGLIEASSRDEHYSARILKVTRMEPDPVLFAIPKNYKIQDVGDPGIK